MEKKDLVDLMKLPHKRYLLNMGAGHRTFRKLFGLTRDEVKQAKREVRDWLEKTEPTKPITLPKILILDIETAPIKALIWRMWDQVNNIDQITSEWFMLTWSAKWLDSSEVISERLTSKEALAEDDSRILKPLWKLLDECDIAIAHNGNKFDLPKIRARFLIQGMRPTAPYRQIDTRLVAKREFGLTSNKLEAIARVLKLKGKDSTDFQLWIDCINGSETALKYMETYNIQDVILLEQVYLKLRPWISNHPNVGVYSDVLKPVCGVCGSFKLEETGKFHYTNVGRYPILKCECGAHNSRRVSAIDKDKRDQLLIVR